MLRGRFARGLTLRSGWVDGATDHTAKILADTLPSDTRFEVTYAFEDEAGRLGESAVARFTTAPGARFGRKTSAAQSFVWTADTAGQGYGINPDAGGLVGYAAVADLRPDVFIHCGDTIYAVNGRDIVDGGSGSDTLYGGVPALGLARQALHAARLSFTHPVTGESLVLTAPLPADLAAAWAEIGAAGLPG